MQNLKEEERKLETIEYYNKEGIDRSAPAEANNHKDLKEYYVHNFKKLRMVLL